MIQIRPCTQQEETLIKDGLKTYSLGKLGISETVREGFFHLAAEDENGTLAGGILAEQYFSCCGFVSRLWVSEAFRGKGLGSRLLKEAERLLKEAGCTMVHLDTFDFQAKGFYEKQGYTLFGVLEDCPPGHCRYYLTKRL